MIYLLNMDYCNYGEPLKHNPQSHTHTQKLSLSLSAFMGANNDTIHSFLHPIRGVYILINSHDGSAHTGIHAFLAT